ncbi:hypothetical protein J6590_008556 [Homalodisca vitripennis]|nr:hypothetical protein J6590_008556 [Homalodisca vitripennis]
MSYMEVYDRNTDSWTQTGLNVLKTQISTMHDTISVRCFQFLLNVRGIFHPVELVQRQSECARSLSSMCPAHRHLVLKWIKIDRTRGDSSEITASFGTRSSLSMATFSPLLVLFVLAGFECHMRSMRLEDLEHGRSLKRLSDYGYLRSKSRQTAAATTYVRLQLRRYSVHACLVNC